MDNETEIRRGHQARAIVESDVYQDAVRDVREQLVQAMIDAPIRDDEGIRQIKVMIHLLDKVVSTIHDAMMTGEMAKIQLDRETARRPRQTKEKQ